jgi:hypothetical protein
MSWAKRLSWLRDDRDFLMKDVTAVASMLHRGLVHAALH